MDEAAARPTVTVEVVDLRLGPDRQIAPKSRIASDLQDRRADIQAAIRETTAIITQSVSDPQAPGWGVSKVEAKFGLTLTTEAGVFISKVGAEASFEITITVERG